MTHPVVTVITPTYNHPHTLVEAVESVRAQTYQRWEQLVVDDGSDVPAAEALSQVRDPRVRVIRREHVGIAGLASIYNAALQQARGELIAVLEDDDLWPPDKLAHQVPAFDDPEVTLSWGRAQLVDLEGKPLGVLPNDDRALDLEPRENRPAGTILHEMLMRRGGVGFRQELNFTPVPRHGYRWACRWPAAGASCSTATQRHRQAHLRRHAVARRLPPAVAPGSDFTGRP